MAAAEGAAVSLLDSLSPAAREELRQFVRAEIAETLRSHQEQRRWLTVEQAAGYLGLSISGVRRQVERKRLPVKRLGTRLLIDRQQLDRHLERLD